MMKLSFAVCLAALICLMPFVANASPWTLPQHELVLSTGYTYSFADREYLQTGKNQAFSINGEFLSSTLGISARYGLTDNLEVELQGAFKHLSYDADPVILDVKGDPQSLQDARNQVIDFDTERAGASDMNLAFRYNLYRGAVMVTPEFNLKVPLGYDKPRGTFRNVEEWLSGEDDVLITEDDVTLGDGQVDARLGLLIGTYIPASKTFARGGAGFVYRFGDPGHQVMTDLKVGQFLSPKFIVFGGVRFVKTVTEGEEIGSTFVDTNPTQDARDFGFSSVEIKELRLDRDYTSIEAGAIIKLTGAEMQLSFEKIVDGANVADLTSFGIGLTVPMPDLTAPEEPEVPEATQDVEVIEEEPVVEEPEIEVPEPEPAPAPPPAPAPVLEPEPVTPAPVTPTP